MTFILLKLVLPLLSVADLPPYVPPKGWIIKCYLTTYLFKSKYYPLRGRCREATEGYPPLVTLKLCSGQAKGIFFKINPPPMVPLPTKVGTDSEGGIIHCPLKTYQFESRYYLPIGGVVAKRQRGSCSCK